MCIAYDGLCCSQRDIPSEQFICVGIEIYLRCFALFIFICCTPACLSPAATTHHSLFTCHSQSPKERELLAYGQCRRLGYSMFMTLVIVAIFVVVVCFNTLYSYLRILTPCYKKYEHNAYLSYNSVGGARLAAVNQRVRSVAEALTCLVWCVVCTSK